MHLGVDKEYPQLAHHNFLFSSDSKRNYHEVFHEKVLPQDPTIYLVNSNKTDKTQAPADYENLKVLPHIPYIQDKPFTEEQYSKFRERVLDKLERMGLTNLRQHIVYEDIWTPHDIEHHYASNRGAIYGVVADRKNKGFKFPKQSQYFENLYFVGGSVNPGGGMPMVTLSGQQVADKINAREQGYFARINGRREALVKVLEPLLHGLIGTSVLSGYLMYNRRHLLHFQKRILLAPLNLSVLLFPQEMKPNGYRIYSKV